MKKVTKIKQTDLQFYFRHRFTTYKYITKEINTMIVQKEPFEIVLSDNTSFVPQNNDLLEMWLKQEVEDFCDSE